MEEQDNNSNYILNLILFFRWINTNKLLKNGF